MGALPQGNPPLNVACIYNQVEMVKFLISRDVNVNLASAGGLLRLPDGRVEEVSGKTALEIAYEKANAELITILEPLTNPQIRKRIAASEMEKLQQEREIFEREKAEFARKQAEFESRQAEFEKVEKEREERVNIKLAKVFREKMVQDLAATLETGVNIFDKNKKEIGVNARDFYRNTLLHHIAKNYKLQEQTATALSAIITDPEFEVKLNSPNKDGETPLLTACRFGNFIAANILLGDERVDVKFLSKKAGVLEANALHAACRAGNSDLAAELIKKGVDYKIENKANESPVALMKVCGEREDVAKIAAAIREVVTKKISVIPPSTSIIPSPKKEEVVKKLSNNERKNEAARDLG